MDNNSLNRLEERTLRGCGPENFKYQLLKQHMPLHFHSKYKFNFDVSIVKLEYTKLIHFSADLSPSGTCVPTFLNILGTF
jgi:hypothetical protein